MVGSVETTPTLKSTTLLVSLFHASAALILRKHRKATFLWNEHQRDTTSFFTNKKKKNPGPPATCVGRTGTHISADDISVQLPQPYAPITLSRDKRPCSEWLELLQTILNLGADIFGTDVSLYGLPWAQWVRLLIKKKRCFFTVTLTCKLNMCQNLCGTLNVITFPQAAGAMSPITMSVAARTCGI